jgi:Putative Flp pilus-assembly TadE/G-like
MTTSFGGSRRHTPAVATRRAGAVTNAVAGAMSGSSGQVLVLVTMGIVMLTAFAGIAVDVGQFWSARRHMQTAADAAAIAAAVAVREGNTPTAPADAITSQNGFTNGSNNVTVTVNNPPKSGPYTGNASYVEVIVTQPQPAYFLRALGYDSLGVSVRSVASSVNGPACLYALDPTASSSASFGGTSTATLDCGAIIDSNNSYALTSNGGGVLTASNIGVNGGYSGGGFTPTPVTGVAPSPDPLAYLAEPTYGSTCDYTNAKNKPSNCTKNGVASYCFSPGVYCGGIQVNGNIPVFFSSGTYILLGGGLKVTATNANMSGTNVMFYNTYNSTYSYGAISLSGSNVTNLSAPTTGTYAGILFFQDRSVPLGSSTSKITGASGSTFDGAIYFPTTYVDYAGSSSSNGYTIIVADEVSIIGNSTLLDNYSSLPGGDPIKATALYE